MKRSGVIQESISCFNAGAFSLIPVLGWPGIVMALWRFRVAVFSTNDRWNPARLRLYAGAALALLSLLAQALVLVFFFLKLLRAIRDA